MLADRLITFQSMVKRSPTAKTHVIVATEEHSGLMAEFFRSVWDPEAKSEDVLVARREDARANPAARGEEAPTFLVLSDGRVVGYVTTIPGRIWSSGQVSTGYWIKGLMVLPEYRNGPIGYLLLKEAVRHLDTAMFGMAVALPARRLFQALGFSDMGPIPHRIVLLAPATVAHRLELETLSLPGLPAWLPSLARLARRTGVDRLGGAVAGLLRRIWAGAASLPAIGLICTVGEAVLNEAEIDELWKLMRAGVGTGAVRDGAYVAWRYRRREPEKYRVVTARRRGRLVAVAAIALPRGDPDSRLRGIRVATLSDLIYDPGDSSAGLAALIAAEKAARQMQAHAMLCGTTAFALLNLLARRGYIPIPGNVHFLMRDPANHPPLPSSCDDWWITRGDGESDGI